jgi:hypothetical protein
MFSGITRLSMPNNEQIVPIFCVFGSNFEKKGGHFENGGHFECENTRNECIELNYPEIHVLHDPLCQF